MRISLSKVVPHWFQMCPNSWSDFGQIPYRFPTGPYRFPADFLQIPYRFPTDFLQISFRFLADFLQISYRFPTDFASSQTLSFMLISSTGSQTLFCMLLRFGTFNRASRSCYYRFLFLGYSSRRMLTFALQSGPKLVPPSKKRAPD